LDKPDFALHLLRQMKVRSMRTLTVTAKGQITLRKDLLKHLGIQPGGKLAVQKFPDGRIEIRAARPVGKISDAFGVLKRKNGPSMAIDTMNKVAARGWAGKR
jgi:AbrB family looped-hinge helix DNA binding protein